MSQIKIPLDSSILENKNLTPYQKLEILLFIRKKELPFWDISYSLCAELLKLDISLGEDYYDIIEFYSISCLRLFVSKDFQQKKSDFYLQKAKDLYSILESKFGISSTRVQILQGSISEAVSKLENKEEKLNIKDPLEIYNEILRQDPTHQQAWKRKIACLFDSSNNEAKENAVSELKNYLLIYPSDEKAWLFLSNIYSMYGKYSLAKFCIEELLLLSPSNFLYNIFYADILYSTIGNTNNNKDIETIELSKKYYVRALNLNNESIRAMNGIIMTSKKHHLLTGKVPAQLDNNIADGDISVTNLLLQCYEKSNPDMVVLVKQLIDSI